MGENYEFFYGGTPTSMESNYGNFVGYKMNVSELGIATDPRTANQIKEVSNRLNTGLKKVEVGSVDPRIFESMPEEHLTEIKRQAKLTGAEISVHAPLIEPTGFTDKEGWSEANREKAERQMQMAVERSHKINPDGNIPVTFHTTAVLPEMFERIKTEEGGKKIEKPVAMWVINPQTGKANLLKEEERFFAEGKKPEKYKFDPQKELTRMNEEVWRNTLTHFAFNADRASDLITRAERQTGTLGRGLYEGIKNKKINMEELKNKSPEVAEVAELASREIRTGEIFLKDAYRELKELYNMAYKNTNKEGRKKLEEFNKKVRDNYEKIDPTSKDFNVNVLSEVVQKGTAVLDDIGVPKMYIPFNDFAIDKSSDTFSNIALSSYKKFKEKSPIISIENPPAGMQGLSRGEDLKKVVEETRQKFVKKAMDKEGMSRGEAEKAAEKLIGVTWDVGHINMIRKSGYEKEDLIKETEKIAPLVKHVHLSDNFGFEHTELPMGMGNVPIKEVMEKLGKEGFEAKKIIEAGDWWQHFSNQGALPPVVPTLEAFGSPMYSMHMAPYWNQAIGFQQGSFASPLGYFPEQHFSMYGGGFANLPTDLGGQVPGKQSRFAGAPAD